MLDVSRQVLPIAETLLTEKGALGGIALKNRKNLVATTQKLEWKEMKIGAVKVKLTTATASGYFDSTSKVIDVPTANVLVGDIFSIQDANRKAKSDLRIMITEIVSSTQAKAQKIGGTDVAVTVTDILFLESTSEKQGSTVTRRRGYNTPRTMYNFTQIIRAGHSIPRTVANTNNWDFKDTKLELRNQAYKNFADNIDGLVTSTVRATVVTADGDRNITGGLPYFANNEFNQTSGDLVGPSTDNVKVVNGDITMDHVDKAFKFVIENGGKLNAMVANTAQIMQVSKFEADKININLLSGSNPETLGGAVQVLKSPIKVAGNEINAIYLDLKMPQDEVTFFNTETVEVVPLQGSEALEEIHEPTAKDDNYSIDLLGEWTVKVTNAKENTYTLKKLNVPS